MTLIEYPLASITTSEGLCKLGHVRTCAWLIFHFNFWNISIDSFPIRNSYHSLLWHWVVQLPLENDSMNFFRYYVVPKKILNYVTIVGNIHFMMESIFKRSILSSHTLITYSKYTNNCWGNSHLSRLASIWYYFRVSKTCMRCEMCSS